MQYRPPFEMPFALSDSSIKSSMRQLDVSHKNSSVFGHNLVGLDVPMTPKNELYYNTL